jgi:hypothetical protein
MVATIQDESNGVRQSNVAEMSKVYMREEEERSFWKRE